MTALAHKIRSRAHWEVFVRPADFVADRVHYSELEHIVRKAAVRFRGWPVPFVDDRQQLTGGHDWVGQDIDADMVSHYEAWRMWTSGQFGHLRAVSADWREGREATRVPVGFSGAIEVWEILYYLTEVTEFAARLALSDAGSDVMTIEATLRGLEGRGLVVGQSNRAEFFEPYRSRVPEFTRTVVMPREALVADVRQAAVDLAFELFARFGWQPSKDQLAEHQLELIEGR